MAKIRINGDTSGYIEISAPAVAGSTSITLPATTGGSLLATDANGNLNVDSGVLYVDGVNNRVGIGTTSPSTAFHCTGTARFGANDAVDIEVQIGAGATGNRAAYIDFVGDTTYSDYGLRIIRNGTGANANSLIAHRGTGDLQLNALETGAIGLFTNDTQRLRITSAGNVGIGTTNPLAALHINDALSGGQLLVTTSTSDGTTKYGTLGCVHYTNAEEPLLGVCAESGTNYSNVYVGGGLGEFNATTTILFYTAANSTTTAGSERMRITSGGNVYIGATSPSFGSRFVVEKNASDVVGFADTSAIAGTVVLTLKGGANGTDSTTNYAVFQRTDGNSRGAITATGTNGVNYTSVSDYRLKENVIPFSNGINRLRKLKPSHFNFIGSSNTVLDGFIAHEVQAVVPEAVTGEKDAVDKDGNPKYQGIDQSKLVPLLTAALQEAVIKIEQLEATNASFEARLSALEVKP